ADAVSGATPLAVIKAGGEAAKISDLFFGYVQGSIGEVSALLLLIGGLFLIAKGVIGLIIPATYIISVGVFGVLFTEYGFLFHILSGGIILAGFFMATDYVTSPVSKKGQFVYALGAGLLTSVIRAFGGYPEGVTYAILIMNIVTPLLDKYLKPKKFGKAVKSNG
ncbi:MAG: RnfABCDGE type electron transport complex subunit D, partial [Clostridia bacterium]|nr:RnfABCDGE type electron transport complex subunit D [Clostridia bacterium]